MTEENPKLKNRIHFWGLSGFGDLEARLLHHRRSLAQNVYKEDCTPHHVLQSSS